MSLQPWLLAVLSLAGCSAGPTADLVDPDAACEGDKCDAWDPSSDPANLGPLRERLDELPLSGRILRLPWPASSYRYLDDGIAGDRGGIRGGSALVKYDAAFGLDGAAERWEWEHHGTLGETPPGPDRDHGHGWAAAALLYDGPTVAVDHGAIRFEVWHIEALLSEVSLDVHAVAIGRRCRSVVARDPRGGAHDECRDANAGSFHVVLANLVGLHGRGVVLERLRGLDEHHEIAVGFEVVAAERVSVEVAARLLGGGRRPNGSAASLFSITTRVDVLPEGAESETSIAQVTAAERLEQRDLTYLLEVDRLGTVTGGEWLGDSTADHPQRLWLPIHDLEGRDLGLENPHVRAAEVLALVAGE